MATEGGEGKRIRKCQTSSGVASLPMDIVETGILCRLPVKQLFRRKLVCKLWYSVIKSPNFIRNHYHHYSNRPIFVQISVDLPSIFINPRNRGGNLLFSYYLGLPMRCIFAGPVDGLFLLLLPNPDKMVVHYRMAKFNPATRQFCQLGDFKFNFLNDAPCLRKNYKFGFGTCSRHSNINISLSNNVYKVVLLYLRRKPRDGAVAKVYTVGGAGDGDWRIIKAILPRYFVINYSQYAKNNISMNGKCYWLSNDYACILVFDMDDEVFHEMNSPIPSDHHNPKHIFGASFSEVRCCGDEDNSVALFLLKSDFVDISILMDKDKWHWIRRVVTLHCSTHFYFIIPPCEFSIPIPSNWRCHRHEL